MKRSRVPIAEKRVPEQRQNQNSSKPKATLSNPKVMRKNISVSMVNTRSAKEHKTKKCAVEGPTEPAGKIDLETPDQSVVKVERKTKKEWMILKQKERRSQRGLQRWSE